jgi:hypothetical protein
MRVGAVRELYVYYRVRSAHAADARRAVAAMQRELRALYPGLEARLLTRDIDDDGAPTWMETYALDKAEASRGVGPDVERAIEAHALPLLPFVDGPRHVEAFHSDE